MKPEERELAERSARACHTGGEWRRGVCEACLVRTGKADRRGSFSFNPATGWYKCFKCGLVGRLRGYEDLPEQLEEPEEKPVMGPPEGFTELGRGEGRVARVFEPARRLLRNRGLGNEGLWREAHVGATLEGRFSHRVVVPVLSPDGAWLGHVGRAWRDDAFLKYLYPKGMDRHVLYNHAAALRTTETPLYVVEGTMDALALWPDAVAVLGKPSQPQLWALADAPRPVVVVLDGDAWQEGEALAMRLRLEGQRAGNVRLPPKVDPDEVEKAWLLEEARRALA